VELVVNSMLDLCSFNCRACNASNSFCCFSATVNACHNRVYLIYRNTDLLGIHGDSMLSLGDETRIRLQHQHIPVSVLVILDSGIPCSRQVCH
jgi:hypothetical protein